MCLGTCGDPRGVGVSYEQGTPVDLSYFTHEGGAEGAYQDNVGRAQGLFKGFYLKALYRGTSLIRNTPPPSDRHRALGIFLL